jgi:serine/threonine-protein kinase
VLQGTAFGHYELLTLLGRGGMGEVWRARDTTIDRIVAIKVLLPHLSEDQAFAERFRREARAAAQLNSPHVVPIHRHGEIDGRLYVDMRLVEGRDLETVLADGPLDPTRAVRIVEQIANALHAAHKVGLIHRDVKPSNILIDENDYAYLIDFGIARTADQTGITSTGSVIGTWHYMAPERLGAGDVDGRSDVYALACVLYQALTGRRPFPGDSLESQVGAHLSAPPPQPSTSHPEVPTGLDAVIAAGMAKRPDDRFATAVALANAARDAITPPQPRPVSRPSAPAVGVDSTAPTQQGLAVKATHLAPHHLSLAPVPAAAAPPPWRRGKIQLVSAAVLVAVVAVVAIAIFGFSNRDTASPQSSDQQGQPVPLVILVTIDGGAVTPTNEQLRSKVNEPIGMVIDSNVVANVRIGTTPERTLTVDARRNQVFKFTPSAQGTVVIELPDLKQVIATVDVQ